MFITNACAANTNTKPVAQSVQETQDSAKPLAQIQSQIQSGWTSMIPMVLIFIVFYLLLIRPQEKRRRQQEALVKGVKKGEEVVTSSGIFGIVTQINDNDNTVEVAIAKDTNIKILRAAITDIISRKTTTLAKEK